MDCIEQIGVLSPLVGRTVNALVEVEAAASEIAACSRGKRFRIRAELSWNGWRALHRSLLEDVSHLLESVGENVEPHHDRSWSKWRQKVLARDLVFESVFPASMDVDDLDKHRIHRQWKSPHVDEVREGVLDRIFGAASSPIELRERIEEHRMAVSTSIVAIKRRNAKAEHANGRRSGKASELSTIEAREALAFLARTFSDISLLTDGFLRVYPGPRGRAELEDEAQAIVDAILLGERAFARNAGSDQRRRAQRRAYYAGLHQAHDEAGVNPAFYFNDPEIEQRLAYAVG